MDFIEELNGAISFGLDGFKKFIQQKLELNKEYLEQLFGVQEGAQITVLNYLIQQQSIDKNNLEMDEAQQDFTQYIDYVLSHTHDKNVGEPLHQAIVSGKIHLALHLLNATFVEDDLNMHKKDESSEEPKDVLVKSGKIKFDVDRRDVEGRTLLSLVINTKNANLLRSVLKKQPNIHAVTSMLKSRIKFQPLHQAVTLDFKEGVRLLAACGAQLANPFGPLMETPVVLACRLCKINALEALLESPVEQLMLGPIHNESLEESKEANRAIDELCIHIAHNRRKNEAIRGVAMLLCRGAEPPRNEEMRNLLSSNRFALLKAIHSYLEDKPELVEPFVNRCHQTEGGLYKIIYASNSWGSSIRRLFGLPSEAAFLVENLIIRKYTEVTNLESKSTILSIKAAEKLNPQDSPVKLYAEFVRRYNLAYENQYIPNRWSTMRWMIAEGKCNWESVTEYAKLNPKSRTAIIFKEMFPLLDQDDEPNLNDEKLLRINK